MGTEQVGHARRIETWLRLGTLTSNVAGPVRPVLAEKLLKENSGFNR
jgi:hypothetical protein